MNYQQVLQVAKELGVEVREDLDSDAEELGVCVYWDNFIRIKGSLPEAKKIQVLLHEIAHYTGKKELLNRETLAHYGDQEVYILVEEAIAEAATIGIQLACNTPIDFTAFKFLTSQCDVYGIEFDVDVLPEVERVMDFLRKYTKGLTRNADNYNIKERGGE